MVKVFAIAVAAFAIAGIAYDWHLLITSITFTPAGWLIMWPIRRRFDHFVKQMNAGLDRIDQSLNRINQSIDRIEEAPFSSPRSRRVSMRAQRKPLVRSAQGPTSLMKLTNGL